jgi:hypothetical protein
MIRSLTIYVEANPIFLSKDGVSIIKLYIIEKVSLHKTWLQVAQDYIPFGFQRIYAFNSLSYTFTEVQLMRCI